MSEVLENAVRQLTEALETINNETKFIHYSISGEPYSSEEYKDFHLAKNSFNRFFGSRITCLESRNSDSFPYQKYVIVYGCTFYCLLKSLEEAA